MGIIANIGQRWAKKNGYVKPSGQRRFNAAKIDRTVQTWVTQPTSIDSELRHALEVCVARARDLARNNDYVRRYLQMCRANIVGPNGFKLQSKVPSNIARAQIDESASLAIEANWSEYSSFGNCEVTGTMTAIDVDNLYVTHLMRDGEFLGIKRFAWPRNKWRYAIQVLDPMLLDVHVNKVLPNGGAIVMGVEFDEYRAPVAYWIKKESKSPHHVDVGREKHDRIPADMVIHRFIPEFAYQTRGFPPIVAAILRLQMIDGFEEAAVIAARLGASNVMNLVDPENGAGYVGDGTQDDDGNYEVSTEPGAVNRLPFGSELLDWSPHYPNIEYGQFMKATLGGVATSLGLTRNSLAGDLESVNYSSLRQGAMWERDLWMCLQRQMTDSFKSVWFCDWLTSAQMTRSIKIGNSHLNTSEANLTRYKVHKFQGRRWKSVDPMKDTQSSILAAMSNQTSISQIIRDNGEDPDEVFAEIAAEQEKWRAAGITPVEILAAMQATQQNEAAQSEETND